MLIPLTEPTAPRYIYINPANNQVHLLVPMVGGQEISTDNTCKSTASLDEFFKQGAALRELSAYQSALEFDLQLLDSGHPLKAPKQQRLDQIKEYIKAISAMKGGYLDSITELMQVPSNLYSIQLRPRAQDPESSVVNPVFSMNRGNDDTGTPLSALYNAMYAAYANAKIASLAPQTQLSHAVLATLPEQFINFEDIQRTLTEQCHLLFDLTVDFTKTIDGTAVSQASIDMLMGFTPDNPATTQDYIDSLLGTCALNLFETIPTPPFYKVQDNPDKIEKLSILTQFFLAQVNLYCVANKISSSNFGAIFDESPELSDALASVVSSSLETGAPVEEKICAFFNEHTNVFGMSQPLAQVDSELIKQKFNRTYATVTATAENPHMDDFMVLDTTTQAGKFVSHQGSICTDFAELVAPSLDSDYFKNIRVDFEAQYVPVIPHKNEHVQASIDLDIETLISRIKDDDQLKKLPLKAQLQCMKSPLFQLRTFLHDIAQGKQDEAQGLLKENPEAQTLLKTPGLFTDYSGRAFNCTAYEYAYWAKDTHMCRMLEQHMDEATKTELLQRVNAIEEHGLKYSQNGNDRCSKHFDFSPLKRALNNYVQRYDEWKMTENWDAMKSAWMQVGLAQRDLPVHVINEYFRPDRSFDPTPSFKESKLPRVVTFYNFDTDKDETLFPLVVSDFSGLGVDFALTRWGGKWPGGGGAWSVGEDGVALTDLAAISRLDEVRTIELTQSRENLKSIEPGVALSARTNDIEAISDRETVNTFTAAAYTAINQYLNWSRNNTSLYSKGNGFFTYFRHGEAGRVRAERLESELRDSKTFEEVTEVIDEFLNDPQTRRHNHSLATFLLRELSPIEGSPWADPDDHPNQLVPGI